MNTTRGGRIIRAVRRFVTILVLALVTFLHASDAGLCPDGCTDRDHTTQSASTSDIDHSSNVCLLCLARLLVGPEATTAAPGPVRREPVSVPPVLLSATPLRGIDHPPRIS